MPETVAKSNKTALLLAPQMSYTDATRMMESHGARMANFTEAVMDEDFVNLTRGLSVVVDSEGAPRKSAYYKILRESHAFEEISWFGHASIEENEFLCVTEGSLLSIMEKKPLVLEYKWAHFGKGFGAWGIYAYPAQANTIARVAMADWPAGQPVGKDGTERKEGGFLDALDRAFETGKVERIATSLVRLIRNVR